MLIVDTVRAVRVRKCRSLMWQFGSQLTPNLRNFVGITMEKEESVQENVLKLPSSVKAADLPHRPVCIADIFRGKGLMKAQLGTRT